MGKRRARRLGPFLRALDEAERIVAERFIPASTAATLAEIPVEDAREEIRQLWRGMEDRGYCPMDALPRHFDGEGEGNEED